MTFEYSSDVRTPIERVFDWYARPGAMRRLMPPWHPVRVVREAASLRDGVAVLGLPGGIRWTARHVADQFSPPHRFVDELVTPGMGTVLAWRHVHDFQQVGAASTRVVDRVATRVPTPLLTPMFRFRHDQLAADLAAHDHSRRWRAEPMTVAITGSSGLVGSALSAFLSSGGHDVVRLVRRDPRRPDERRWNPRNPNPAVLSGLDAVVHLAGASIGGRYTPAHRRAIRDSRVDPTRLLAEAAVRAPRGPRTLVTASAIGYYGPDRGDEILTEDSPAGTGFLADVVREWEAATRAASDAGLRVVRVRTGIVQTPRGGMLRLQYPLFWAGLGGRLGDGRQWMSWIGIDDLLDIYLRALADVSLSGVINAVAPQPVSNADHARTLGRVLGRPAVLPVPRFGPRLLLGDQGTRELAEASQRVRPARLEAAGHTFRHPRLEPALRHLFGRQADDAGR